MRSLIVEFKVISSHLGNYKVIQFCVYYVGISLSKILRMSRLSILFGKDNLSFDTIWLH